MSKKRDLRKLVSFSKNEADLDIIRQDMKDGWFIVSLVQNGNNYVGIMEQIENICDENNNIRIFLPSRKTGSSILKNLPI